MDYERIGYDGRDNRGRGGRGPHAGESDRRFTRESPPPSIPPRPQQSTSSTSTTPYQSIPLRPAGPQRYQDSPAISHSSNSSPAYWRPENSSRQGQGAPLPPRPLAKRYRSPPPAASVASSIPPLPLRDPRGWDSSRGGFREASDRAHGRWVSSSSSRDEYGAPPLSRGGGASAWERDRERERDSHLRDRERARSFMSEPRRGAFEVPYRIKGGPDPRKRSRGSEEDEREEEMFAAGREKPVLADWRPRSGRREVLDRGIPLRRNDHGHPYPTPTRIEPRDGRLPRITSPTTTRSDSGSNDPPSNPTNSLPSDSKFARRRTRPARSLSPGEISEGTPPRSLSPRSPRSRSRSRSRTRSPPLVPREAAKGSPTRALLNHPLLSEREQEGRQYLPPYQDRETEARRSRSVTRTPPRGGSTPPRAPPAVSSSSPQFPPRQPVIMKFVYQPPLQAGKETTIGPPAEPSSSKLPVQNGDDSMDVVSEPPRAPSPIPNPPPQLANSPAPRPFPSPNLVPTPSTPLLPLSGSPHLRDQLERHLSPALRLSISPLQKPSGNPPSSLRGSLPPPSPSMLLDGIQPDPPLPSPPTTEEQLPTTTEGLRPNSPPSSFNEQPMDVEPDVDDERRRLSPSPQPRPNSTPPSPPRDFSSILGTIISTRKDDGAANAVMDENRQRTIKERSKINVIRDLTNQNFFESFQENHERLRPFLFQDFAARDLRRVEKAFQLRSEYKARNDDWRAHCRRLDRIKDRIHRRRQPATVPTTPSIDQAGLPFYLEPVTPGAGPSTVSSRPNRRNTNSAYGYGDAARSEAEFQEILERLETADMRDPDVRATRTAAVVPDMLLDETERRDLFAFDDSRRLVVDPEDFYDIHAPLDLWTEEEVQIFCKRFQATPKQFGLIAEHLNGSKTTAQCVLFYYRMKTTIDFRSLSSRGRDRRGRTKTRRRADVTDVKTSTKAAFLMSNLKRTKDDPEYDEDSPPPSPNSGRRLPMADSPSVFQPGGASFRPPPQADDDLPRSTFKKPRTPKSREFASQLGQAALLPSDGMLEAAEVLGALSGFPGQTEGEEDEDNAAWKGKKRKGKVDFEFEAEAKAAARKKSSSSSYWSVAERNEFLRLLAVYGKDWSRLAKGLEHKTAVQCRNWFQNNSKKLNLAEIARNANAVFDDDGDDEIGSGAATPSGDFTVPLGVPLSETLGSSGLAIPRAGFFVRDGSTRATSLDADDKPLKAGMLIRNLLNDESPYQEAPAPAGDDWFGGGNGGGDADSTTTEDEGDDASDKVKPPSTRSPQARHIDPPSRAPRLHAGYNLPMYGSDAGVDPRYGSPIGVPSLGYRAAPPPLSSHYPTYASLDHRYDPHGRPAVMTNGHWQPSPASAYAFHPIPPPLPTEFFRRPIGLPIRQESHVPHHSLNHQLPSAHTHQYPPTNYALPPLPLPSPKSQGHPSPNSQR